MTTCLKMLCLASHALSISHQRLFQNDQLDIYFQAHLTITTTSESFLQCLTSQCFHPGAEASADLSLLALLCEHCWHCIETRCLWKGRDGVWGVCARC